MLLRQVRGCLSDQEPATLFCNPVMAQMDLPQARAVFEDVHEVVFDHSIIYAIVM